MPIVVTPELGIPFPFDTTAEEIRGFREKARAYFNTIQVLERGGLEIEVGDEDKRESHQILSEEKFPPAKKLTPGVIVNLEALLTEWDHEVLDAKRKLKNYVTNRLVIESTDPDPKIRLRALELLGKTSTAAVFSDKLEVSVTHRTITDIENELKRTLDLYSGDFHEIVNAPAPPPARVADFDVADELGEE